MSQSSHHRETPENRRHFYRIDDEVILKYRELPGGAGGRQLDDKEKQVGRAILLCSRLTEYHRRMQLLLSRVRRESPSTARFLGLLKEKTDLLASLLLEGDIGSLEEYRSKVQLSAGGIAFRTHKEFRRNAVISIQMILLPSFVAIETEGRVIRGKRYLREIDGCLFETSVEFMNMKESTRDLIAKHVFEKTVVQLRNTS